METTHPVASKVNIFEYRDYRKFLQDWFQQAKKTRRSYSYRAFAQKAGFHTSNFLMLVIQGKRNLTEESVTRVATGLGLNKQEQEFFRNLVFFNQAGSHAEKDAYYQRLLQSKKVSQLQPIEKQQYAYYATWYHPVVRELVASKEFDGTPEWIANRLSSTVTPAQIAKSLELLETLGIIQKTEGPRYRQVNTLISTGPEVSSIVVHNYHKSLLDLSKSVMDELSLDYRDVSALTLGVSRERLPEIRNKVREFRKEVLKMVSGENEPEEVFQLNIQLFPVTKMNAKLNNQHKGRNYENQ